MNCLQAEGMFLHSGDGSELSGVLSGVSADHVGGLLAAALVPAVVALFLTCSRDRAAAGRRWAVAFRAGYESSSSTVRMIAVLLVISAMIHIGLVPGHWAHTPLISFLFAVDGALLVAAAYAAFAWRRWRLPTCLLLLSGLAAYLVFIASGTEEADEVGLLAKLAELSALTLLLIPHKPGQKRWRRASRWSLAGVSLVIMSACTGGAAWATQLQPPRPGTAHHHQAGMDLQPVPPGPATPEQQAAAAKLVADARVAVARYEDVKVALADGYEPSNFGGNTDHYSNERYSKSGLDLAHPYALVYAKTRRGPVLLGPMYQVGEGRQGADPGGPITRWHAHTNVCVGLPLFAGIETPYGTCPLLSFKVGTSHMMHIWTAPNPNGPFGDLDETWVARLVAG